jgi:pyrroloquinoline-quinone synthase
MAEHTLVDRLDAIVGRYMAELQWSRYSEERLTVAGARLYVGQHGIFTRESRRHWAFVVGNCPEIAVRRFIERENLYEEEGIAEASHFEKLVALGEALGMTRMAIVGAEPLPSTRAALHIWENLTKNRPWWVGMAAKAVLERSNAPHCGNMSALEGQRWMRHLGLSRDAVEFWLMHDAIDQVHGSGAYDLLTEYVRSERAVTEVLAAAEDSMVAWKLFLDGIARAAENEEVVVR